MQVKADYSQHRPVFYLCPEEDTYQPAPLPPSLLSISKGDRQPLFRRQPPLLKIRHVLSSLRGSTLESVQCYVERLMGLLSEE